MTENIVEALPAERISKEIQQKKAERSGKSVAASDAAPSDFSSGTPSVADEDGRSMMSSQSEGFVHASQMGDSSSGLNRDRAQKTKVQLWSDLKIIGEFLYDDSIRCDDANDIKLSLEPLPSFTLSPF